REPDPQSASPGAPDSLPAGRVGRPHGLDGSFYVTRPRPRLLSLGVTVTLAGRSAPIVRRAGTEQRPIVRLEGIDERSAAEALRGTELFVDGGDALALGEGEWWAHELEGCEVVDGERLLGSVNRLIELPSCEALEVRAADGGEVILVPMVKDAVRLVAPARKRIEVDVEFLDLAGRARHAGAPRIADEPGAET
ncbi:MAG: rRNA processing protein RimM, partial [Solirubrobacterales bacterium]|nr:rRNA processing protein RimM [Solirubrobacterales bacterium]